MKSITLSCILLLAVFFTNPVTAQWFNNGSNVRLINLNNRVTIGSSSTVYKLEAVRTDGDYRIARFRNSASFGDRTALIDIQNGAGILWRYGVGGTNNGLGLNAGQFYIERGGIGSVLTIPVNGNVGIGSNFPFRKLEVSGDERLTSTSGERYLEFVRFGSDIGQTDWRFAHTGGALYVDVSDDDFATFSCSPAQFGSCSDNFQFTVNGNAFATTWQTSDLKLKSNINDVSNAMEIIKQLKPKTFFYKSGEYSALNLPKTKQYGFVAQDIEKVLPSLVLSSKQVVSISANGERKMEEIKAVNYTQMIPMLTKAMQEQQAQIEQQQQQINELKQIISTLQNGQSSKIITSATDATLDQSIPNPTSNVSSISYNIPASSKNARLVVTDNLGKPIKQVTLSTGKGAVDIDVSALGSGSYNYSLWIDGKHIQSRKMIVNH